MKRAELLFFAAALMLAGCSSVSGLFSDKDKPLEGERMSVLSMQQSLKPDAQASAMSESMMLPAPWRNDFWPQAGGYPNHAMQNLALNTALKRVWSADIGEGVDEYPLTMQPLVVNGVVYTLDSDSNVKAFSADNGRVLWQTSIAKDGEDENVIGGGLSFGENFLFATNGYDQIMALSPREGKILWRAKLPAAARAAPTIMNGRVFVPTLDNRLLALAAANGSVLWEYQGLSEMTGLIGAASPAVTDDVAVAAFSSGEIVALRVENGSVAWTDNLSGINAFGGLASLADIRALPVAERGLVFAVSYGGRMAAIDSRTGSRVWQRDIASMHTPWVAGDFVFVLTLDQSLIAMNARDGSIAWVSDLPKFADPEDRDEPIRWVGPLLAGGRLLVAGSHGYVLDVNPRNGALGRGWKAGDSVSVPPVVAAETLYLLDNGGTLLAYR
ncbi:MAG: PQQ-binding-like beta-propeller repeat protein [Alphaproteobacteria bacterium]|nr:PQQ-binding-like beta-propeller repeat protein [Alphaproteobacteria bacterium]